MKSRTMGEAQRRVDVLVRIPINSDTYSENIRTAIRSIRTVVGAERCSAGTLPGVSELGQGFPAFFACLFRSAATCPPRRLCAEAFSWGEQIWPSPNGVSFSSLALKCFVQTPCLGLLEEGIVKRQRGQAEHPQNC